MEQRASGNESSVSLSLRITPMLSRHMASNLISWS